MQQGKDCAANQWYHVTINGKYLHIAVEADPRIGWLNVLGLPCLIGNFSSELGDVYAQAVRCIQTGLNVPDVRDGVEPASLDGDGLQNGRLEVRLRVACLVGQQPLNFLEPVGGCRWRDHMRL
jgi:hypothetical protein